LVTTADLTPGERAEVARILRQCIADGMTGWWLAFRPGEEPRAFPRCTDLLRDVHSSFTDGRYLLVRIPASPDTLRHFLP
jgi:hypothetical protein